MRRIGLGLISVMVFLIGCSPAGSSTESEMKLEEWDEIRAASGQLPRDDPYLAAREQLVQEIERLIESDPAVPIAAEDRVLEALRKVPRHEFVPDDVKHLSYANIALPIGQNQTISQPYVVALMSGALGLKGGEKVLEVGSGSGYQAAVLAELGAEVCTIEIVEALGRRAAQTLQRLGYENKVHVRIGDGYQGWPEEAPFDAVIVTAAPDHVPQPLVDQLKVGGRMVIPVGSVGEIQELILLTKTAQGVQEERLIPVQFVPMTGEAQQSKSQP